MRETASSVTSVWMCMRGRHLALRVFVIFYIRLCVCASERGRHLVTSFISAFFLVYVIFYLFLFFEYVPYSHAHGFCQGADVEGEAAIARQMDANMRRMSLEFLDHN